MAMPPSALSDVTANCRLGVGEIPRSITSQPAASNPAIVAARTIGPEARVSRQTKIRPPSRQVPNAWENPTATSGVKVWPTMPRTPVIPIFNGFIVSWKNHQNTTIPALWYGFAPEEQDVYNPRVFYSRAVTLEQFLSAE